jgi:hypothetical protein
MVDITMNQIRPLTPALLPVIEVSLESRLPVPSNSLNGGKMLQMRQQAAKNALG